MNHLLLVVHYPCVLQFMADGSAKSAVLMSGKPGCFIAGADIRVSGTLFSLHNVEPKYNISFQLLSELQVSVEISL